MSGVPPEFDPTVPLPEGVTVLEASAGTGKTHAVASIVVAEVAGGRPIDEILVVTFTRKATGTLRERVWQRLNEAFDALGSTTPTDDELIAHLRIGSPAEVAERQARLRRAIGAFDTATIATTHGFCQQILAGLGAAGDAERDVAVVENVDELVADAVDDLFVRRFHAGGDVLFTRSVAAAIARKVIANPDAEIAPVDPGREAEVLRLRFAKTLRKRIVDQKRHGRLLTYDDLLSRLRATIRDEHSGPVAIERLRRRFTMAVVDEFQDTDSVQWEIFEAAFAAPPSRLVLVGDPKQAIYAFRGGDVHAYLGAVDHATHRLGLATSWRSDQPLLDGLDAFFDGAELGHEAITHRPLTARPGAELPRVEPAIGAPFTVRVVDRDQQALPLNKDGTLSKGPVRDFIADDLAAEAVRILGSGADILERDSSGAVTRRAPIAPGHLAVLVRRHADAERARAALQRAGIPAVVHGGGGVLTTEAARAWLTLLRALESPSFNARVRAVAHGPFLAWDATTLATAGDDDWDHLDECLRDWGAALRFHGVMGVLRAVERSQGLTARILGTVGGERLLSDLRHVAELLHAEQVARPGSPATLAAWLAEHLDRERGAEVDEDRRRLESDADAVAIQTIHGAKGLEFPVVLLPSLWEGPWTPADDPPVFHDEHGVRNVGVGGQGDIHDEQVRRAGEERDQEELRLLYVALTRAKHRVVVWWATGNDARTSPFARILLGRSGGSGEVALRLGTAPTEQQIRDALHLRAFTGGGAIGVEDATGATADRFTPAEAADDVLAIAAFEREFDRRWTRTSYSGLTSAAHDDAPSRGAVLEVVEVDEAAKVDEPEDERADQPPADDPLAITVPLSALPGGARFGTMVHEILEKVDFTAPDLATLLRHRLDTDGAARLIPDQVDALVAGLVAALETPLGPTFADRALASVDRRDRLDELGFDLPLAGGDHPVGAVTMEAIADVFATELAADDPLVDYHQRLRDPVLATTVRGFLNGSIDLVTRIDGRHVVIDYKTNHLGPRGEPLTAWHYRPTAMAEAMADAHYPLQAALYAVALHRYLRWRQPGYDPATHLGGVAYLFLRGMTGADVPRVDGQPCGVFAWHPPASFVTALSDLLDRGAP